MPSRKCHAGDTVFVRGTVLEAASDGFQVTFDDGVMFGVTVWVPARECARLEDVGELRPIRRNGRYLER